MVAYAKHAIALLDERSRDLPPTYDKTKNSKKVRYHSTKSQSSIRAKATCAKSGRDPCLQNEYQKPFSTVQITIILCNTKNEKGR